MSIFISQVLIADSASSHNGQVINIRVHQGKLDFGAARAVDGDEIIDGSGLLAMPGFADIFCRIGEPGLEQKETLKTVTAAAVAGGYTTLMMLPNTRPAIDTAAQVSFIVEKSKSLPVQVFPMGAISTGCRGEDLAEMYDMHAAGAVAFSDGLHAVQNAQVMLKALQYVKAVGATVISMPVEENLTRHALMHEGIASTRLGLPGMPAMAEHLMLQRDIALLEYTKSRLHITGISTAASVQLIKQAKEKGLQITCSVSPYHLHFTDSHLGDYDSALKVNPPLRTEADVAALRQAVIDGTIDCIASHHQPQDWDAKTCEFEYAAYGMSTLEVCFSAVKTACPILSPERLSELFTANPRKIFGLPAVSLSHQAIANMVLVAPDEKYTFTADMIKSLGKNNAFVGKELLGKIHRVLL